MSRKKVRSSEEEVATARDGGSQLCAVKGTEVSIVKGVSEVEIEREEAAEAAAAEKGFVRVDPMLRWDKRDRAMVICCYSMEFFQRLNGNEVMSCEGNNWAMNREGVGDVCSSWKQKKKSVGRSELIDSRETKYFGTSVLLWVWDESRSRSCHNLIRCSTTLLSSTVVLYLIENLH